MDKKKMEIRSMSEQPVLSEGRHIQGYAIVWGVESRVLCDWDGEFVEIIENGAVDNELLQRSDVKALFNHMRDYLLARYTNGEGTLSLTIDERGLRYDFDAPETTWGNDVLELVRRGDLRGSSFAFTADDVAYSQRPDGTRVRRVRKLSGLYDVSIVVDPAYTQTSVDARAFDAPEKGRSVEECRKRMNKLFNH